MSEPTVVMALDFHDSTPIHWHHFEPLSEQAQAWKDGGASAGEWLEFLSAQRG